MIGIVVMINREGHDCSTAQNLRDIRALNAKKFIIVDKIRVYSSGGGNKDAYLALDTDNNFHTIYPYELLKKVNQ